MTEIAPETVDAAYQDKLVNDDIDLAKYRVVVRGDVVRQKLEDKIVADAIQPGPQREVSGDLHRRERGRTRRRPRSRSATSCTARRTTRQGASQGDIADDDPSWDQAKADADAAYAKLVRRPERSSTRWPGPRATRPAPAA